ncbi:hypothetical protein J2805_003795 [Arthrobacter oryzae]|nr:hypothetical protein [Arthrobacter oryzae]
MVAAILKGSEVRLVQTGGPEDDPTAIVTDPFNDSLVVVSEADEPLATMQLTRMPGMPPDNAKPPDSQNPGQPPHILLE